MRLNNDNLLNVSDFTNIKSQLFLDAYILVDNAYFVGLVQQGSSNYIKRSPTRIGKTRVNVSGVNYMSLTDGGINFTGSSAQPVIGNTNNGSMSIANTLFISSYGAVSTLYGFEFSTDNSNWYSLEEFTNLPAQATILQGAFIGSIPGLTTDDTFSVRSFITNSEGKYISSVVQFLIT